MRSFSSTVVVAPRPPAGQADAAPQLSLEEIRICRRIRVASDEPDHCQPILVGIDPPSNSRNCSLEVQDVSQACTNGGVFNDRLVLMNGDVGIPGDSGGGWSFGNKAYGSHKGNCADVPGREVFSVADLYDEALGVSVRIA